MHKQEDLNKKTIRFTAETDQKLHKLAEKIGLTKLALFTVMVDYFYKSKKDPRDLNDELLKKELVKRTDTIIAFIKVMEEELLRPLKKDGERIIKAQAGIVGQFNNIGTQNNQNATALNNQSTSIEKIAGYLQKINNAQLEKTRLKAKFSEILEYYIKSRESMGMVARQVDKDNLTKNIRQQVDNL